MVLPNDEIVEVVSGDESPSEAKAEVTPELIEKIRIIYQSALDNYADTPEESVAVMKDMTSKLSESGLAGTEFVIEDMHKILDEAGTDAQKFAELAAQDTSIANYMTGVEIGEPDVAEPKAEAPAAAEAAKPDAQAEEAKKDNMFMKLLNGDGALDLKELEGMGPFAAIMMMVTAMFDPEMREKLFDKIKDAGNENKADGPEAAATEKPAGEPSEPPPAQKVEGPAAEPAEVAPVIDLDQSQTALEQMDAIANKAMELTEGDTNNKYRDAAREYKIDMAELEEKLDAAGGDAVLEQAIQEEMALRAQEFAKALNEPAQLIDKNNPTGGPVATQVFYSDPYERIYDPDIKALGGQANGVVDAIAADLGVELEPGVDIDAIMGGLDFPIEPIMLDPGFGPGLPLGGYYPGGVIEPGIDPDFPNISVDPGFGGFEPVFPTEPIMLDPGFDPGLPLGGYYPGGVIEPDFPNIPVDPGFNTTPTATGNDPDFPNITVDPGFDTTPTITSNDPDFPNIPVDPGFDPEPMVFMTEVETPDEPNLTGEDIRHAVREGISMIASTFGFNADPAPENVKAVDPKVDTTLAQEAKEPELVNTGGGELNIQTLGNG